MIRVALAVSILFCDSENFSIEMKTLNRVMVERKVHCPMLSSSLSAFPLLLPLFFPLPLFFLFSWLPQTTFRPPDNTSQRPLHLNHALNNKVFLIERNENVSASWPRRHQNIVDLEDGGEDDSRVEQSSWKCFQEGYEPSEGPLMARSPEQQWTCRFYEGFKNSYLALFGSRWI